MAEYIEREALYQILTEQKDKETGAYSKGRNAGLDVARSALHNREITPAADVVGVVRCRDCVALYRENERFKQHCCRTGALVEDDDFCSYGERKDGENT